MNRNRNKMADSRLVFPRNKNAMFSKSKNCKIILEYQFIYMKIVRNIIFFHYRFFLFMPIWWWYGCFSVSSHAQDTSIAALSFKSRLWLEMFCEYHLRFQAMTWVLTWKYSKFLTWARLEAVQDFSWIRPLSLQNGVHQWSLC